MLFGLMCVILSFRMPRLLSRGALNLANVELARVFSSPHSAESSPILGVGIRSFAPEDLDAIDELGLGCANLSSETAGPLRLVTNLLRGAVALDSENGQAHRELGKILLLQGDFENALDELTVAEAFQPRNSLIHLEIGSIYDEVGEPSKATEEYEKAGYGPKWDSAVVNYVVLAEEHLTSGDLGLAVQTLRQALRADSDNLYVHYLLDTIGRETPSLGLPQQDLEHFSMRQWDDQRFGSLIARAFEKLIEEERLDGEVASQVVSFLIWQGHYVEARNALAYLCDKGEKSAYSCYVDTGEIWLRQGEWGQAIGAFSRAIELDPVCDTGVYLQIGFAYEQAGNPDAAFDWYTRYSEAAPDDLMGLRHLASLCEKYPQECGAQNWQETLVQRTDDKLIASELLGISPDEIVLGPNLIDNGDFERGDRQPEGWKWLTWIGGDRGKGAFHGGIDSLGAYEGVQALRISNLWLEQVQDLGPVRAGYWSQLRPGTSLEGQSLYVLSLYYRIAGSQKRAKIYFPGGDEVLFGSTSLPPTDGQWKKLLLIGWVETPSRERDRQALLIYAFQGYQDAYVDQVALRQLTLRSNASFDRELFPLWYAED